MLPASPVRRPALDATMMVARLRLSPRSASWKTADRISMASSFPAWLEPMAATLTQERFTAPGWAFERKLDGIRLLAFKQGDKVRLLSRNRLSQNESYRGVVEAIRDLPARDVILDGEATGV